MIQIDEMANLRPDLSKLPTSIWIENTKNAPKKHSAYYLKVFPKNVNPSKFGGFQISIGSNPEFLRDVTLQDLKLDRADVDIIKRWIIDNESLLRKVCEGSFSAKELVCQSGYVPPRTHSEVKELRSGTSVVTGAAPPTPPAPEPVAESFLQYARKRMLNKQRIEFGLPPLP